MKHLRRVAGGIVVIAVAATGLAASSLLDGAVPADFSAQAGPVAVYVPPADQVLGCPGPVLPAVEDDTGASSVPAAENAQQSATVTETVPGAQTRLTAIDQRAQQQPSGTVVEATGGDPLTVATAGPEQRADTAYTIVGAIPQAQAGARAAVPGGAVAYWSDAGELRGLDAGLCSAPAAEHWVVAGDTTTGSTARVMIDNPGLTTVTAAVELWGAHGPIDVAGSHQVSVAPGSTSSLSLNVAAPQERRLVVHVTSDGGYVNVGVAQSKLDGLLPQGVDRAASVAAPAALQVIPSVAISSSEIGDDNGPIVRLLSPGHDAHVSVRLISADGVTLLRGAQEVDLTDGEVQDVSLGGVADGVYSVVVSADEPVLAGARGVRRGGEVVSSEGSLSVSLGTAADFAWSAGQSDVVTALDETIAVPPDVTGSLTLTSVPGDGQDTVAQLDALAADGGSASGAERTVTLVGFGSDGSQLGARDLTVAQLSSHSVSLADLADGSQLAAVQVRSSAGQSGSLVGLAVTARAGDVEGSLAVLQPIRTESSAAIIDVVRGALG